jgi:hypothetical protein
MKTNLILFSILTMFVLGVKGQNYNFKNVGDTLRPITVISFDEPTQYITILPLQNNIWQIGGPYKTFFNAPYTPPNVIVTDTINDYPINNLSTFELDIDSSLLSAYWYNIFIDFRHKYDCDSLQDGGYITISWDGGFTWMNIIDDTNAPFWFTPHLDNGGYGNYNLYNTSSMLYNGQHGFTGYSGTWIHSSMAWYNPSSKKKNKAFTFPDTVKLRFNFISDSIQNHREGWMIDQIRLFCIDMGDGIKEYTEGKTHSYFYPNPVKTTATFVMNRTYNDVHYELIDSKGVIISTSNRGTCDEFIFERGSISPGIYFMKLFLDSNLIDIHRMVITP